jgi:hypothetical protein
MSRRMGFVCFLASLMLAPAAFAADEEGTEETQDEPASDEPASEEPASEEPASDEPASEEPASEEAAPAEAPAKEVAPEEPAKVEAAPETTEEPAPEEEPAKAPMKKGMPGLPPLPDIGPAPFTFSPIDGIDLSIIGRVQARATLFDADDPTNNDPVVYGDPGLREGVSIRRARFGVVGVVADMFRLAVEGGWDNRYDAIHPTESGFRLVEASVGAQPVPAIGVAVGVVRVAYGREATASSSSLVMHERSMASEHMGKGREPGVALGGALGPEGHAVLPATALHWSFGVSNGSDDWFGDVDPQPRLAGRARLDLGSDWDDKESSWTLPEKAALSVGGSASYKRGLDANTLSLGADVGVRVWRFSLQGELLFASAEPAFDTEGYPTLQEARESLGWYGRVGVAIIPEHLEVAFRADGYNDNRTVDDAGDRLDLAVGVNTGCFDGRLRLQVFYIHRMELSDGHNTPNDSIVLQVQGRI